MRKPEILAPAGSMKAMEAAVKAGADAVYMGGSRFGARAYADNPGTDELIEAIRYVHLYDKKLYLTLNTLLKEEEVCRVGEFLLPYYNAGLDGIIIQDVGVFSYVKERFPGLPLHASTQMNISGLASARMMKEAGAVRIVPARELSFEEIRNIKRATGLEVECFVHGALCYCYSGRCLMSSILGGRSGNRGRCAQPCRLPYEVTGSDHGSYVLSPKDLCTISLIPKLCQAGIDSFKIEGRMKNPEYVATIVSLYRKYLDRYWAHPDREYSVSEEDWNLLLEAYNRGGFTEGYYENQNGRHMMSMERPNHQGIRVGQVETVRDGKIFFHPEIPIHKGDLIEVIMAQNEDNITLTSPEDAQKGQMFSLNARKLKNIKPGFSLYRTGNPWWKNHLEETLLSGEKKISLTGRAEFVIGQPARLVMHTEYGDELTAEGDLVTRAQEQPVTEEQLRRPLSQTGNSRFVFASLEIHVEEQAFLPLGGVKRLRRKGLEMLEEQCKRKGTRSLDEEKQETQKEGLRMQERDPQMSHEKAVSCLVDGTKGRRECAEFKKTQTGKVYGKTGMDCGGSVPELRVSAEDKDKLPLLLTMEEVDGIYIPFEEMSSEERTEILLQARKTEKKVFYALPYVFRNEAQAELGRIWDDILREQPAGLLLRNIDEFAWMREKLREGGAEKMEILLDQSLYAYNQRAISMYEMWSGVQREQLRFTYPLELNGREWQSLHLNDGEIMVYGRIPLMVSAQCVTKNTKKCLGTPGYVTMTDRYQKKFYVRRHCSSCYNTIWNGAPLSLAGRKTELEEREPASIRLHFTNEKEQEMRRIIRTFYEEWHDLAITEQMRGDFTRGHYKRGIE